MSFAPLAIPALDDVPASYTIGVGRTFARELTLSLLDTRVITDADLEERPKHELELASRALSRRWTQITDGMRYFDWQLHIDPTPDGCFYGYHSPPDTLWASIRTTDGPVSCRHVYIRDGIQALENVRAGLGQTVLATLYDAFRMLPTSITPSYALGIAEYMYWYGEADESVALEEMMACYDVKSVDELKSVTDVFTRAQFFAAMPEWVARPKRVLTHRQVRLAAKRDDYAQEVVDAMDALWNIVRFYGPFADLRSEDIGAEPIDFALLVRWSDDDEITRVVDDFLHHAADGDYVTAGSVTPLQVVGDDFANWLKAMESSALLAKAVERVLALFEAHERQLSRIMVRV
ncbi:PRTRC system protein F [Burkholderia sp. BCC1988]|uniref:PRTRC system protein F n=1 Tax=Burkholderia sp. BCC1988 TaxID=2817443 RepID=UPI002AB0F28E|nr:PRTRC system protein F [Burkholderia sp. BCC1988]